MTLTSTLRVLPAALALAAMACASNPKTNVHPAGEDQATSEGDAELDPDLVAAMVGAAADWAIDLSVAAQPDLVQAWEPHDATGTCLPRDFGSFAFKKALDYGPDDESVSILDPELLTLFSMYTYPAKSADLASEFEAPLGDMGRTCGAGAGAFVTVTITDPRFPGGGMVGICAHKVEGDLTLVEQVVVFVRDGWTHKVRSTWPQGVEEASVPALRAAIATAFNPCPPRAAAGGEVATNLRVGATFE